MIMLENRNTKKFLLKYILQIGLKKFLWLKKLKTLFHGYMLLMISIVKKLLEQFIKKLQKTNQLGFRIEKAIKKRKQTIYQIERIW